MTTTPVVLGLDLSLAAPCMATRENVWSLSTAGKRTDGYPERMTRIRQVRRWAAAQLDEVRPDLLVLEGPSYNSKETVSAWDRAHLWWSVLETAEGLRIPTGIAPPASVKKYATGNGNCGKFDMIGSAVRAMPHLEIAGPDADGLADAAWLAALGYDWLGAPIAAARHRAAVHGVAWPARELVRAA